MFFFVRTSGALRSMRCATSALVRPAAHLVRESLTQVISPLTNSDSDQTTLRKRTIREVTSHSLGRTERAIFSSKGLVTDMAQEHEYVCNGCGKPTARKMLTVKKVLFTSMGAGSKTTRARVKQWLCPPCVQKDEDWNLPANRQPSERVPTVKFDDEVLDELPLDERIRNGV